MSVILKVAFDTETRGSTHDTGLIAPAEIALRKTEVIEGIQQVSLSHTVIAADAYDPFPETERSLLVILELDQRYLFYPQQSMKFGCKILPFG
jgi:hypothetical protein